MHIGLSGNDDVLPNIYSRFSYGRYIFYDPDSYLEPYIAPAGLDTKIRRAP